MEDSKIEKPQFLSAKTETPNQTLLAKSAIQISVESTHPK